MIPRHVCLHVVVLRSGFDAPHLLDEQVFRHHGSDVGYEHLREAELLVAKVDGLRAAREVVAFQIEFEVAGGQLLEQHLALAPGERAQVREQLCGGEGLGHVVVCAAVEARDLVGHRVARGEQQHGRAHARATQVGHYGKSVFLRQHDVQHDHVVPSDFGPGQTRRAVMHDVGAVAVFLKDVRERPRQPHVVLDDEYLHARNRLPRAVSPPLYRRC